MLWTFFACGAVIGAFTATVTIAVTSEEVRRWRQRRRMALVVQFGRAALLAESNGVVSGRRS